MTTLDDLHHCHKNIRSIEPTSLVGPFPVSLGLGLATLTGSHMHRDSDAHVVLDPMMALTSQG